MRQALYEKAADYIRLMIERERYEIGRQIPTENELAQQLGMSRPTIRQALEVLTREGLLVKVKGKGTFVSQPKLVHESTSFIRSYQKEAEENHYILKTKVLTLEKIKPTEEIAEALKLKGGEKAIQLIRVRHLENLYNNAPVVYTTVYVPYKVFPEMLSVDFTDISFYDALNNHNLSVDVASKRLEVVMPTQDIAANLSISVYEPVILVVSTGKTKDGSIIEYSVSYYPASRSCVYSEAHGK